MLINAEILKQFDNFHLVVDYIDSTGKNIHMDEVLPNEYCYEWNICKTKSQKEKADPIFKNWNDKPVFKNYNIKRMSKGRVFDYMIREMDKNLSDMIFSYEIPKKFFCDIETQITEKLDPLNPTGMVETISLVGGVNVWLFGLKPIQDSDVKYIQDNINKYFLKYNETYKVKYKQFEDEKEMIYYFFFKLVPKIPFITGWNFVDFDWTYLVSRARILGLNIDKAFRNKYNPFIYNSFLPKDMIVCDYMDIFDQYDKSIKTKRSLKLDDVAEQVVGAKKIEYDGNLNQLYDNDFVKFLYYNAVDSILCKLIDFETNCVDLKFSLSTLNKISFYKTESKVPCGELLLQNAFLEYKNKLFIKDDSIEIEEKNISGGYVKEPKPAYYEDICVLDFSSLYPSIIRQFNVSPETYSGQKDDIKDFDNLNKDDLIIMKSTSVYKKEDGVLPTLLTDIYNRRKQIQKQSLEDEKNLLEIENFLKKKGIK